MTEAYGLVEFTDEVRASIVQQQTPATVLGALTQSFGRLLANPTFMRERIEEIGVHSDEVCLHEEPDQGFVVLARGASKSRRIRENRTPLYRTITAHCGRFMGFMRAAPICSVGNPMCRNIQVRSPV